jgi:hypothetical protein
MLKKIVVKHVLIVYSRRSLEFGIPSQGWHDRIILAATSPRCGSSGIDLIENALVERV